MSTTEIVENRTIIMRRSFIDVINKLKSDMGENVEEWKWEKINQLFVEHMSGIAEFSRGPYPLSGGFDTVNSWGTGKFGGGAGWRMVVDFANLSNSRIIIAGGQSGHITSNHCEDLLEIYVEGKYIQPLLYNTPEDFVEEKVEAIWTLKP